MTEGAPTARSVDLPSGLEDRFSALGVAIVEHALTPADLARMDRAWPILPPGTGGARSAAFAAEDLAWLASHDAVSGLARRLGRGAMAAELLPLMPPMQLVRALALDKSASANWFVPWHQDRADDGIDRSIDRLERIVTLRIHLDDCGEDDGPLEVLPGSHLHGRLARDAVERYARSVEPLLCLAVRGDILAMRPLLLHRSQRARVPSARRVLHLEWSPADGSRQ